MNAVTKTYGTVHEVDAQRLNCPYPTIQLKIMLCHSRVKIGDTVKVLADDPAAVDDIKSLCRQLGHEFLGSKTRIDNMVTVYEIYVKKTG